MRDTRYISGKSRTITANGACVNNSDNNNKKKGKKIRGQKIFEVNIWDKNAFSCTYYNLANYSDRLNVSRDPLLH